MRVLALIDSLSLGGAESLLVAAAAAGRHAGFELEVASLDHPRPERAQLRALLENHGIRPRFVGITGLLRPSSLLGVAEAIRASNCDVVHAHLEYAATLGPIAGRITRRPVVCTFHHVPQRAHGREALKERLALEAATTSRAVVFVSEASLRGFAARYGGRRNWTVIHNGVDTSRFHPGERTLPSDLRFLLGSPVAVLVGAMRPGKGQDLAIRAWPKVLREVPDARLLLVGSGPMEPMLQAEAVQLGVQSHVIFAGMRTDVPALLRASDIAILPSQMEALPTTLLEAAATGKAVVATSVGGTREIVQDGVTGILVRSRQPSELADAIVGLLVDRLRREAMGRAARDLVRRRFNLRDWAADLRVLYERACEAPRVRKGVPDVPLH